MAVYKLLRGVHRHNGKRIKRGEKFTAEPKEVAAIRHRLEIISEPAEEIEQPEDEREPLTYEKEHRGGGRYQVKCVETGAVITGHLLSSADADALVKSLNGGDDE